MSDIMLVARKEFDGFFASPAAFLFLGAFLAATLFVFFWVETFFARNIADVRGSLIRINPREPEVPVQHVGLPLGALDALTRLDAAL